MNIKSALKRVPGVSHVRQAHLTILRSVYGDLYHKVIFRKIWTENRWGDAESRSGSGSSIRETIHLRNGLANLLERLRVRRLLDLPCGDFNWMNEVALPSEAVYVGGDIVEEIVIANQERYGCEARLFLTLDVLRDTLPTADVILCRDCLVHFSFLDISAALRNLKRSGAAYLLTTHFTGNRTNYDIPTGQWRPLNLTRPPFNFPPPLFVIDEECSELGGRYRDKRLALWMLEDLPS